MATYHINRSSHLSHILNAHGWHSAKVSECADFGMWCEAGVESTLSSIDLFNGQVTRIIDDKLCMFELLSEFNLQNLTIDTFSQLPDYLRFLKSTNSAVFCFLKTTLGAGGSGVYVFNNLKDLIHTLLNKNNDDGQMIIQQGIRDVALIDNRKFKIRTYVLVTADWKTYMYKDSLIVLHQETYSPESISSAVQLSPNSGDTTMLLSDEPDLSGLNKVIEETVYKTIKCLKQKSIGIPNSGSYHLFGYDFICDSQKQIYLIETNAFPDLERRDAVGKSLSKKMMSDLKGLIIDPLVFGLTPALGGFHYLG